MTQVQLTDDAERESTGPYLPTGQYGLHPERRRQPTGDKSYWSRGNRDHLRKRHIKAVIREKSDQAADGKKKSSVPDRRIKPPVKFQKI
ncbi:hypothetical protein ACWD4B_31290 [Streptomyces sp. NPDC002536]